MSHVRQQLVDGLVSAVTDLETTGPRVFASHNQRLIVDAGQLPGLLVYREARTTEDVEDDALGGALMRKLRLTVKGVVKESENSEELLDVIAAEVEAAVPRDLGGIAIDCLPTQTRFIYPSGATDRETAAVEIEFLVTYRTMANAPETAI